MPLNTDAIIDAVSTVCEQHGLRVTATSALKAGAMTFLGTVAGAFLLGPPGIIMGTAVGGAVAYSNSNNFMSVVTIIRKMSSADRRKLADAVTGVIKDLNAQDAVALAAILNTNKEAIMRIIADFFWKEMSMRVVQ